MSRDLMLAALMSSGFLSREDRRAYLAAMQREANKPAPTPKKMER